MLKDVKTADYVETFWLLCRKFLNRAQSNIQTVIKRSCNGFRVSLDANDPVGHALQ
jgi:hypothetical protein